MNDFTTKSTLFGETKTPRSHRFVLGLVDCVVWKWEIPEHPGTLISSLTGSSTAHPRHRWPLVSCCCSSWVSSSFLRNTISQLMRWDCFHLEMQ